MSPCRGPRRQLTFKNTGVRKFRGREDDGNLKQSVDKFIQSVNRYFLLENIGIEDQLYIAKGFLDIASSIQSFGVEKNLEVNDVGATKQTNKPESRTEDFESPISKYVEQNRVRISKSNQYESNKDPPTYQNVFIDYCLYGQ